MRTPSDDSNHSSSHNSSPLRHVLSSDNRQERSSSNTRMSVRGTVKNLFRSSKTVDGMSYVTTNGNSESTSSSIWNRNASKLKFSSPLINNQLSHSQPIVTESLTYDNTYFESSFIDHTEQTPLIDRRSKSKCHDHTITLFTSLHSNNHNNNSNNNNDHRDAHLNREDLHLPLDTDGLHRSHSCTDRITVPSINLEVDLFTKTSTIPPSEANLQPNSSDVVSSRSSDSIPSLLSTYLSPQQPNPMLSSTSPQVNGYGKNETNKSQESLFSCPSLVDKRPSFNPLTTARTTQDLAAKQGNDVLILIANWVLRSPEDFQGKIVLLIFMMKILYFVYFIDYLVQKELKSFFALLESLRSSFRSWTSQIKEILAIRVKEKKSKNDLFFLCLNKRIYDYFHIFIGC